MLELIQTLLLLFSCWSAVAKGNPDFAPTDFGQGCLISFVKPEVVSHALLSAEIRAKVRIVLEGRATDGLGNQLAPSFDYSCSSGDRLGQSSALTNTDNGWEFDCLIPASNGASCNGDRMAIFVRAAFQAHGAVLCSREGKQEFDLCNVPSLQIRPPDPVTNQDQCQPGGISLEVESVEPDPGNVFGVVVQGVVILSGGPALPGDFELFCRMNGRPIPPSAVMRNIDSERFQCNFVVSNPAECGSGSGPSGMTVEAIWSKTSSRYGVYCGNHAISEIEYCVDVLTYDATAMDITMQTTPTSNMSGTSPQRMCVIQDFSVESVRAIPVPDDATKATLDVFVLFGGVTPPEFAANAKFEYTCTGSEPTNGIAGQQMPTERGFQFTCTVNIASPFDCGANQLEISAFVEIETTPTSLGCSRQAERGFSYCPNASTGEAIVQVPQTETGTLQIPPIIPSHCSIKDFNVDLVRAQPIENDVSQLSLDVSILYEKVGPSQDGKDPAVDYACESSGAMVTVGALQEVDRGYMFGCIVEIVNPFNCTGNAVRIVGIATVDPSEGMRGCSRRAERTFMYCVDPQTGEVKINFVGNNELSERGAVPPSHSGKACEFRNYRVEIAEISPHPQSLARAVLDILITVGNVAPLEVKGLIDMSYSCRTAVEEGKVSGATQRSGRFEFSCSVGVPLPFVCDPHKIDIVSKLTIPDNQHSFGCEWEHRATASYCLVHRSGARDVTAQRVPPPVAGHVENIRFHHNKIPTVPQTDIHLPSSDLGSANRQNYQSALERPIQQSFGLGKEQCGTQEFQVTFRQIQPHPSSFTKVLLEIFVRSAAQSNVLLRRSCVSEGIQGRISSVVYRRGVASFTCVLDVRNPFQCGQNIIDVDVEGTLGVGGNQECIVEGGRRISYCLDKRTARVRVLDYPDRDQHWEKGVESPSPPSQARNSWRLYSRRMAPGACRFGPMTIDLSRVYSSGRARGRGRRITFHILVRFSYGSHPKDVIDEGLLDFRNLCTLHGKPGAISPVHAENGALEFSCTLNMPWVYECGANNVNIQVEAYERNVTATGVGLQQYRPCRHEAERRVSFCLDKRTGRSRLISSRLIDESHTHRDGQDACFVRILQSETVTVQQVHGQHDLVATVQAAYNKRAPDQSSNWPGFEPFNPVQDIHCACQSNGVTGRISGLQVTQGRLWFTCTVPFRDKFDCLTTEIEALVYLDPRLGTDPSDDACTDTSSVASFSYCKRPECRLYATDMSFNSVHGLAVNRSSVRVLLICTHAVEVCRDCFEVTGPASPVVEHLQYTNDDHPTYYVYISWEEFYRGPVNLSVETARRKPGCSLDLLATVANPHCNGDDSVQAGVVRDLTFVALEQNDVLVGTMGYETIKGCGRGASGTSRS